MVTGTMCICCSDVARDGSHLRLHRRALKMTFDLACKFAQFNFSCAVDVERSPIRLAIVESNRFVQHNDYFVCR